MKECLKLPGITLINVPSENIIGNIAVEKLMLDMAERWADPSKNRFMAVLWNAFGIVDMTISQNIPETGKEAVHIIMQIMEDKEFIVRGNFLCDKYGGYRLSSYRVEDQLKEK